MVGRIDGGGHPLGHQAVRPILVALAPLVLHHRDLVGQPLGRQGVQQETHPVGLQPERPLEVGGRDELPVAGAVGVGAAVDAAADVLQGMEEVRVVVLGSLEHHVLEQVGEAGATRPLVLGADAVADVHRRQGQRVVLQQEHGQPVGQPVLLDGKRGEGILLNGHGTSGAGRAQGADIPPVKVRVYAGMISDG